MIITTAYNAGKSCLTGQPIRPGDQISPIGRGAWALATEVADRLDKAGATRPTIVDTTAKAA